MLVFRGVDIKDGCRALVASFFGLLWIGEDVFWSVAFFDLERLLKNCRFGIRFVVVSK